MLEIPIGAKILPLLLAGWMAVMMPNGQIITGNVWTELPVIDVQDNVDYWEIEQETTGGGILRVFVDKDGGYGFEVFHGIRHPKGGADFIINKWEKGRDWNEFFNSLTKKEQRVVNMWRGKLEKERDKTIKEITEMSGG